MTLVILVIFGIPIALAIWLVVRAVSAKNRIEELSHRLGALESEIVRLKREKESPKPVESGLPASKASGNCHSCSSHAETRRRASAGDLFAATSS